MASNLVIWHRSVRVWVFRMTGKTFSPPRLTRVVVWLLIFGNWAY